MLRGNKYLNPISPRAFRVWIIGELESREGGQIARHAARLFVENGYTQSDLNNLLEQFTGDNQVQAIARVSLKRAKRAINV